MSDDHEFARRLADHERRLRASERASQASLRSLEGGTIETYDEDGNVVQQIGLLADGRVGVLDMVATTPEPPRAAGVTVAESAESVVVTWDGSWEDDQPAGVTPAYVGVHLLVPPDPDDEEEFPHEPADETELARLPISGGSVVVPADAGVPVDVNLVTVSAGSAWSTPCEAGRATARYFLEAEDVAPTDGLPPESSPTPEVVDGIGVVWVRLPKVENADPVTVEVFASRASGVVADALSLEGTVPNGGTVAIGTVGGVPLQAGETIYIVARAQDVDGVGPVSPERSGTPLEVGFEQVSQAIKDQITAADGKATSAQADAAQAIADALDAFLAAQAADGKAEGAQATADAKGATRPQGTAPVPEVFYRWAGAVNASASEKVVGGSVEKSNEFPAPGARTSSSTLSERWPGSNNLATAVAPRPSPFSISGSEWFTRYTSIGDPNSGDFGPRPRRSGGWVLGGEKWTIAYTVRRSTAGEFGPPTITASGGPARITHARSHDANFQAGADVGVRVWMTFTIGQAGETLPSNTRISVIPRAKTPDLEVSVYDIDLYPGDYDPAREWFDGDSLGSQEFANDLWINTTGGANTPHRWNGKTWVSVTDKAATDAAAAASAAQTTANSKASPADVEAARLAAVQAAATDATTKANAARTAAENAAAADATSKANAAQAAATAAAAADAQSKADAAKAAAEQAAKDYADLVAAGEGGAALDAARTYAEEQAAAAQAAAQAAAAADAQSKADAAQAAAAADASTKASAAQAAAEAKAAEAKTAADAAASAAATADGKAVTAQNTANSKGKVIIQSATPATADRLAQNLWIDTTNIGSPAAPGNVPKRWNGTAWVAVTDKVATDAVAAASAAQSAANNAASAAATADGKAVAAQTAASNAASLAGTKGEVIFSNTEPPTAKREAQNLWIDTGNGNVAKRWSGSAWVPVQDSAVQAAAQQASTARAEAQAAQTAADSAASAASTAQTAATNAATAAATADGKAVAAQTAANTAQTTANGKGKVIIQSATPATADRLAQNLWIDTTNVGGVPGNIAKRWNGTAWVAVQDASIQAAAQAAAAAQSSANSAILAASTAQSTADGKNAVRYGPAITGSSTPPTPAGTADGDLYFGRDGLTMVQQWRRVSGAWVKEQIDGAVLTHIDAGSITTGTLNVALLLEAESILSRIVAAEEITAEMLAAEVLIAARAYIEEGLTVGDITLSPGEGLVIPQPDGRRILLPADGSPADIAANLLAYSLTVRDALTIQGKQNLISSGASVKVASGVSAPGRAPTVDRYWPSTPIPEGVFAPENSRGMVRAHNADGWYVPHSFFGGSLRFVSDAGEPTFVADFAANFQPDGGITRIGTSYYVLGVGINGGPRDGRWFVKRFDSSFNETGEWEYTTSWGVPRRPAIGTDGTNVVISRTATNPSGGARTIIITRHNAATGAYIDQPVSTAAPNQQLSAVTSVILLDGFYLTTGPRWVRAYSASTGARDTTREWVLADAADLVGLGSDGTRLHHLDAQARLWTYSTLAADTSRTIDYSWYDSNPAGTGVHETARGPARSFVQSARSWFRVQTDDPYNTGLPDDPNSVRIWVDGQRQTPDLAPGQTSAVYEIPTTGTTTKAPSFAVAGNSAGVIESEEPVGWKAYGDGRLTQERAPVAPADVVNKAALDDLGWYAVANATDTGNMTGTTHRHPASITFASPGPSAVYQVVIDVDAQVNTSGADNRTGLKIDGSTSGSQITTASSGTGRLGGSRTYMVTGLAAGSHTAEIYTLSSSGTTRLYSATTITIRRIR